MSRDNSKVARERRRTEAEARQQKYDKLTLSEKLKQAGPKERFKLLAKLPESTET